MDKKDYNKNYYEKNKAKIAEKLYCKETCPHCQKVVSHQNMKSHQKTSYCKSTGRMLRDSAIVYEDEICEEIIYIDRKPE